MTVSGEVITSDPEPTPDSTLNETQGEDNRPLLSSSTSETISAGISNYWDSIVLTIIVILMLTILLMNFVRRFNWMKVNFS